LNVLSKATDHPSAEDIYIKVHKKNPAIGITTVYRTLELLVNLGAVHKFEFGEGKSRYEIIHELHTLGHHHHLICLNCKRIINYNDFLEEELELIKKTEMALSKKHKFKINNHVIEFYGICTECQRS
jgi:Fur family ferric uptake transcriptional regulator